MKRDDIEPLDPELVALLSDERASSAPTEARDRVRARLAMAIPGMLGGGGGNDGGGGEPGASEGGPSAPATGGGPSGVAGSVSATASAWAPRGFLIALAAFTAGGLAGTYLGAQKTPPDRIVYVDRVVPSPVASSAAVSSAIPIRGAPDVAPSTATVPPQIATPPARSTPSAAPIAAASAPSNARSTLAAERALLDEARTEIVSGRPQEGLAVLNRHARTFARGQLGEEREALAIQALVLIGRSDDARARAAAFRRNTPSSVFLPAVEASLASIP